MYEHHLCWLHLLAASFSAKHDFISYLTASSVQVGEKFHNSVHKQFSRQIPTLACKTDCFCMQSILGAPKPPSACSSILFNHEENELQFFSHSLMLAKVCHHCYAGKS